MTPPNEATARLLETLAAAQVQLEKAADQFAFYADEHAKKRTPDGDAKGAVNHQWALACAKADHALRAALPDLTALLDQRAGDVPCPDAARYDQGECCGGHCPTPTASSPIGNGKADDSALRQHFQRMMDAAANYVEPATYIARHPDLDRIGDCKWVREFSEPDQHASDRGRTETSRRRDQAFINDMIYMLDGPEQRAALRTPAASSADAGLVEAITAIKQAGRYVPVGDGDFDPYGSTSEAVDAAVDRVLAIFAAHRAQEPQS